MNKFDISCIERSFSDELEMLLDRLLGNDSDSRNLFEDVIIRINVLVGIMAGKYYNISYVLLEGNVRFVLLVYILIT